jgi:hypothetical protein
MHKGGKHMNIEAIYDDIYKLIQDSNICAEVGVDPRNDTIEVNITWGDWKHDHLHCDWLISNYLDSFSIRCIKSETVTEEDGSDTYSSIHYFKILEDEEVS